LLSISECHIFIVSSFVILLTVLHYTIDWENISVKKAQKIETCICFFLC